jgi:hypothetical protein
MHEDRLQSRARLLKIEKFSVMGTANLRLDIV